MWGLPAGDGRATWGPRPRNYMLLVNQIDTKVLKGIGGKAGKTAQPMVRRGRWVSYDIKIAGKQRNLVGGVGGIE